LRIRVLDALSAISGEDRESSPAAKQSVEAAINLATLQ